MNFDVLLREAAAEADAIFLNNLPEIQPHQFSARFERRMRKLITRAKHPVRYQVMRYAAAVLLAILTLFGAVFVVSPEVRAAVVGWVKSTFFDQVKYSNAVTDSAIRYDYRLGLVLDGYELYTVIEDTDNTVYLYVNDSGKGLKFGYSYPSEEAVNSFFVEVGDHQEYSGLVNGIKADIYLTADKNKSNMIVWYDKETGVIFQVHAFADRETLVELAESVEITNN